MGADLLQSFFSHRVQPLRQWEMTMWIYPGPSCPDSPFSEKLGGMEINTWVPGVLAHGAILNVGTGPVPLREGVDNPWVSSLKPTFSYLCRFWFLNVCVFLRMVLGMFVALHGVVTLPDDVVR
jgi:hypothetical protein